MSWRQGVGAVDHEDLPPVRRRDGAVFQVVPEVGVGLLRLVVGVEQEHEHASYGVLGQPLS